MKTSHENDLGLLEDKSQQRSDGTELRSLTRFCHERSEDQVNLKQEGKGEKSSMHFSFYFISINIYIFTYI